MFKGAFFIIRKAFVTFEKISQQRKRKLWE
jgi:hypothetical protein